MAQWNQMSQFLNPDEWAKSIGKHASDWSPSTPDKWDVEDGIDEMIQKLRVLMDNTQNINEQLQYLEKISKLEEVRSGIRDKRDKSNAALKLFNDMMPRKKVTISEDGKRITQSDEMNMSDDEARKKILDTMVQLGMNPSNVLSADKQADSIARAGDKDMQTANARLLSQIIESTAAELKDIEGKVGGIMGVALQKKDPQGYSELIKRRDYLRKQLDDIRSGGKGSAQASPVRGGKAASDWLDTASDGSGGGPQLQWLLRQLIDASQGNQ